MRALVAAWCPLPTHSQCDITGEEGSPLPGTKGFHATFVSSAEKLDFIFQRWWEDSDKARKRGRENRGTERKGRKWGAWEDGQKGRRGAVEGGQS